MVLLWHGGATCGPIALDDSDTHNLPENVRPTSQEHLAPEAPICPQWYHSLHRSRKRLLTYHLTTALASQHLQTCFSTGKETGPKPGRDVPKFPQQVHGIVRPRTQLSEYHSCITSFPLSHSGFFKEEHGPKYPGHKLWHRPKTTFTAVTVILITPNVYSMWLDFLYSPSISKRTWQSSLHFPAPHNFMLHFSYLLNG